MRKTISVVVPAVLLAVAVYAGGDVWKTKPYTQWDEKDVAAVLQSSPWVKLNVSLPGGLGEAAPEYNPGVSGPGSMPNRTASPASATPIPKVGSGDDPSPGSSGNTYNLFWYSSRTIREAFARRAVLKGTMTPDNAAKMVAGNPDAYEVLVNGADMSAFQGRPEDALKDSAFIELKKTKKKISVANVVFQRSADKVVGILFNFPKKDAEGQPSIPVDEKEIGFSMRVSGGWLRASFNLKQMADSQGPDL
jgi:hypothetical protein